MSSRKMFFEIATLGTVPSLLVHGSFTIRKCPDSRQCVLPKDTLTLTHT